MQIIEKPWGKEEIIEINDRYMMKKLNFSIMLIKTGVLRKKLINTEVTWK